MKRRETTKVTHPHATPTWLSSVDAAAMVQGLADLLPNAAVVVLDSEHRVQIWSAGAERLLGWRAAQIVGEPCPQGVMCEGLPLDDPSPVGAVVRVRKADGTHLTARHYGRTLGGGVIHLLEAVEERPPVPLLGPEGTTFHGLVSRDPAMLAVFDVVRSVAATEATVLVRGASGTGKELVAQALHAESDRRRGPFVPVNCAAFSPTLLESELFGHKKGAYTGATTDREGIFAQADHGTLFLDEVAELSLDLQAKLLRVLQERTFVPVGGTRPVKVDVRVVAATHKSLRREVQEGRFREDLMYRLRVVPIFLPPLSERPHDVELLLRRSIEQHNRQGRRRVLRIAPDALDALLLHPWPGNVRELLNVVEYAFAVGKGPDLRLTDLPPEFREGRGAAPAPRSPRREAPPKLDAGHIEAALTASHGDVAQAAAKLGISRVTLWRKRRQLGLLP